MRVFGNLMNRIAETVKPQTPEIGMGATILMFSDRHAATIVDVREKGKRIRIQEDKVIRVDKNGQSECQTWKFEPNTEGAVRTATLRKNGTYVLEGETMQSGTIVRVGERDHYYDFGF